MTKFLLVVLLLVNHLQCACAKKSEPSDDASVADKKFESTGLFYNKVGLKPKVVLLDTNVGIDTTEQSSILPTPEVDYEVEKRRRERRKNRKRRRKNRRRRRKKNRRRHKKEFRDKLQLKGRTEQVVSRSNGQKLKQDGWCKTERMKVKVREPGCLSRVIANNFCRGQCNSYFVPKVIGSDTNKDGAFKSCSFCKPKKSVVTSVTLVCPGKSPAYVRKKMLRVFECRCLSEILES